MFLLIVNFPWSAWMTKELVVTVCAMAAAAVSKNVARVRVIFFMRLFRTALFAEWQSAVSLCHVDFLSTVPCRRRREVLYTANRVRNGPCALFLHVALPPGARRARSTRCPRPTR